MCLSLKEIRDIDAMGIRRGLKWQRFGLAIATSCRSQACLEMGVDALLAVVAVQQAVVAEPHSKCPLLEGVELLPGYVHSPLIDRLNFCIA